MSTLHEKLPETVDAQAWRPLDLPAGTQVLGYDNDSRTVTVRPPNGSPVVLESTVPMRTPDTDSGLLAPIDLRLVPDDGGFEPINAPAPVTLPEDLADPIQVGQIDVSVPGAGGSTAVQVGDSVVWPNALEDTDVVARPVLSGAEVTVTLRSSDSPEDIPFDLGLPAGTTVRLGDAPMGAPVPVELAGPDGKAVGDLSAPVAWDADHVPVEAAWKVQDGKPVLHVNRTGDIAWPIAVDPVINDNRYGADLATRPWTYIGAAGTPVAVFYGDAGWGPGMYQRLTTNFSYSQSLAMWWEYSLVGRPTATVLQITAQNMNHDTGQNSLGGPETCTFLGLWNDDYSTSAMGPQWCDTYRNRAGNAGSWTDPLVHMGNKARIGMLTNGPGPRGYFQQSIGTLVVALGDATAPTSTAISAGSTSWNGTPNVTANSQDSGLGVKSINFSSPAGGFAGASVPNSCPGGEVCNQALTTGNVNITALPDGISTVQASAVDPASNHSEATTTVKFDRGGPGIVFSSTLWDGRFDNQDAGPWALTVTASDGTSTSNATARSGVTRVTTYLDNVAIDSPAAQTCAAGNCTMTRSMTGELSNLAQGLHTIRADAMDAAGNPSSSSFSFRVECCFVPQATSWNSTVTSGEVRYDDVNGDGRSDAVFRNASTGAISVELSTGVAFAAPVSWGTWPLIRDFNLYDMDGDGSADLVGRTSAGSVSVGHSMGNGFDDPVSLTTLATSYSVMRLGDVNGDGFGDVVGENASTGATQIVRTDGMAETSRYSGGTWPSTYTFVLDDLNGDGKDDAIGRETSSGTVRAGLSTATGFGATTAWQITAGGDFAVDDVNGDGMADILFRPPSSNTISVRVASGDATQTTLANPRVWTTGWSANRTLTVADVTGDGKGDLVSRDAGNNAMYVGLSYGRNATRTTSTSNDLWSDRTQITLDGDRDYGDVGLDRTLRVDAVDTFNAGPRYGIASIEILVNGTRISPSHYFAPSCTSGCPTNTGQSFIVRRADAPDGEATVKVIVRDGQASSSTTRGASAHVSVKTFQVLFTEPTTITATASSTTSAPPPPWLASANSLSAQSAPAPVDPDPLTRELTSTEESQSLAIVSQSATTAGGSLKLVLGSSGYTSDGVGPLTAGADPTTGRNRVIGAVVHIRLKAPHAYDGEVPAYARAVGTSITPTLYQAHLVSPSVKDLQVQVRWSDSKVIALTPGPDTAAPTLQPVPGTPALPANLPGSD